MLRLIALNNVTVIIPVRGQNNKFLITHGNKLSVIRWDGQSERVSSSELVASLDDPDTGSYIWCDGKADPDGKFWAGNCEKLQKSITNINLINIYYIRSYDSRSSRWLC